MKKRIYVFSLMFLIGFCLVIVFHNYGQDEQYKGDKEFVEKKLADKRSEISKWRTKRDIVITLTIIVGIFGIITGILQKYHNLRQARIATMIIGGVISVITIVNNKVFEVDHRTLSRMIGDGRNIIEYVEIEVQRGYPENNEDARYEWINKVQEKFREFPILADNTNNENISFNLVSIAYALPSEIEPSWISKPPTDRMNFFFVGVGDSSSIKKAKEYSLSNAVENAINYLELQFPVEQNIEPIKFSSLSEYLVKSGKVKDTYFTYDSNKKSFRYYTLWKLDKRDVEIDIDFFALKEKVNVQERVTQSILNPNESPQDYYERRTSVYNRLFNLAKETLPSEDYEKFNEGRLLRRKGLHAEATILFVEILNKNPTFYFGWYNLALAYDSLNDFSQANQAYERASALEPNQPERDASFYNTYGYFLYRHEKYREAMVQFEKALEIDPGHPKARQNLKAARKAIG